MHKTLSFFLGAMFLLSCSSLPVVKVEGGRVEGVASGTEGVVVFKGVPYAAAPVDELRWVAPKSVTPWKGIRKADAFSSIAPQGEDDPKSFYGREFYWDGKPEKSEDCLYLNIWAPASAIGDSEAALPVAMWIHGGAFMNGYGHEVTMDGEKWAQKGVILVTINYRLGILGYLAHPELSAEGGGHSGNYGMLDQIAALKWIKENIAGFGGDPDNITVFGQSAGAMSVKNLVASPLSKGLIAKAIIQSGGGLGLSSLTPSAVNEQEAKDRMGKEIMDDAGFDSLKKMRSCDVAALDAAANAYKAKTFQWLLFSPFNDGYAMTEDFDSAALKGELADIPYMIGYNSQDLPGLGGEPITEFCRLRAAQSSQPVYEYEFHRDLPGDDETSEMPGAFHSAELWYVFGTLSKSWRPFTDADYALSEQMVCAWTDFCKSGNPGWPVFTTDKPYIKDFDAK